MKGQDLLMIHTAERVCERKFPYEKELNSRNTMLDWKIEWEASDSFVTLQIKSNKSDYKITKVTMKFSNKECSVAKDWGSFSNKKSDFIEVLSFDFDSSEIATAVSLAAKSFKCGTTESIYGIINN